MLQMIFALLLFTRPAAAPAAPAAMALAAKGNVLLHHGAAAAKRPSVPELLYPGDRLETPAGGEAELVFFSDRHRELLKVKSMVTVRNNGCAPASAVVRRPPLGTDAIRNLREIAGMAHSGRGGTTVFRGDDDSDIPPPRVTPILDATVLTNRPTLTWQAVPEATSYEVQLKT